MVKAVNNVFSTALSSVAGQAFFPFLGETSFAKCEAKAAVVALKKNLHKQLIQPSKAAELVVLWRSSHWCCIHAPVAVRFWMLLA